MLQNVSFVIPVVNLCKMHFYFFLSSKKFYFLKVNVEWSTLNKK